MIASTLTPHLTCLLTCLWGLFELSPVSQQAFWSVHATCAASEQLQPYAEVINVPALTKDTCEYVRGYIKSFNHIVALGVPVLASIYQSSHLPNSRPCLSEKFLWGRFAFFIPRLRTLLLSVLKNTLISDGDLFSAPFTALPFFCHCCLISNSPRLINI